MLIKLSLFSHLSCWGVFLHCPMEPVHEKDQQRDAVSDDQGIVRVVWLVKVAMQGF